ncbi:hypothetical protein TYRP_013711 [Tyrophagus putrescentiae]|nr:hypothetical protein TYRP_013711 [Tyrophagus putrescentiae]
MIVLSAFRYEVIDDDDDDDYGGGGSGSPDQNNLQQQLNVTTIDKKALDALSKFDRNVRHLLIKGKEASKVDFANILPEFKEAIDQATRVLGELQKLNLNTNYNCKDSRKSKSEGKYSSKKKGKRYGKGDRTLSFSLPIGSRTHRISFYWPKLVRLFLGGDDD